MSESLKPSEEIANHTVPESCVAYREVCGEALTGVRVGQPLSRESSYIQGADAVYVAEDNTMQNVNASYALTLRGPRTWHVRKLLAWEPGDLLLDHWTQYYPVARIGKVRSRSR